MSKPGRPKTPAAERLVEVIQVRLTLQEARQARQQARKEGVSVSEWVRQAIACQVRSGGAVRAL